MAEMILKLNAPGMTSLHKAGLAGLYMTLKAFDKNEVEIEGLEWKLEDKQVTLNWTDKTPKDAFEKLAKQSFWIDDEGFYTFSGLPIQSDDIEKKHLLYRALNSCFFTHKPSFPKGTPTTKVYSIGDMDSKKIHRIKNFSPILIAKPHRDIAKKFFDSKDNYKQEVAVKGWLYPGGVERHSGLSGSTVWKEPVELALILLYAPVGVIFYELKSRKATFKKARWASVIPEINSLESYSNIRSYIAKQGVLTLTANNSADAVLRFLLTVATNQTLNEMQRVSNLLNKHTNLDNSAKQINKQMKCRVITHGEVVWDAQNNVRTATQIVVAGKLNDFENYQLAHSIFENSWQRTTKKSDAENVGENEEEFYINTYSMRELIAENVAVNKPWYLGLSQYLSDKKIRKQIIFYEREKIGIMVEKAIYDDDNKRFFISVCHKSWEMRLGKLGQRTKEENLGDDGFKRLVKNESEKLRTSLLRCKNSTMLREKVVDFWTRAGANKLLQNEGLNRVLPLFSEENWRETKDLALLALISYQPKDKRIADAMQDDNDSNSEGEKE